MALSDCPSVTPALRDPSTTVMRTNNFAVFIIFFGLSLVEALRAHSWGMALLWVAVGVFFLAADAREHNAEHHDKSAR